MSFFRSHGKLLLSGEYVVLDGATALVLPTKYGQTLKVEPIKERKIIWKSYDDRENIWFEDVFLLKRGKLEAENPENEISEKLVSILNEAIKLNPEIITDENGFSISTSLQFPKDWGLGSSSTLIYNIAKWFKVDPFALQEKTFGGSGFDIAAAGNSDPVTFVKTSTGRSILTTKFDPAFKNELFFVYLNKKQNSRDSIEHYRSTNHKDLTEATEKISSITHKIITCTGISEFELLLEIHENIISKLIGLPKIKTKLFPDFPRAIKSLGGWGGDFIIATGGESEKEYFRRKSYTTIFDYKDLIL